MRSIIHLDMDAFYAAVEQRDNPSLAGKPVIVGGSAEGRGVVSTASYEARKYGIHSAMPMREALRLCPHGIFLPVRMQRYLEVSGEIMKILSSYSPVIEPLSLDEAFLDVTGCRLLFGAPVEIAREIVGRIRREQRLSASVGIAPNKFLAKLASDLEKPCGFVEINAENMFTVLDKQPVSRIWGVGPQIGERITKNGFRTIGDLRKAGKNYLRRTLGEIGEHIFALVNGLDDRPVGIEGLPKSISNEVTFPKDLEDRDMLARVLLTLSEKVARRLRQAFMKGRTVVIKLRDSEFQTITRHQTLVEPTDFEEIIFHTAFAMAEKARWGGRKVRLVGVGATNLVLRGEEQKKLFTDAGKEKMERLHAAVDKIRDKYGEGSVRKASALKD
ncbi:MAG: DNA polymerase IV [Bacillota bacterium]